MTTITIIVKLLIVIIMTTIIVKLLIVIIMTTFIFIITNRIKFYSVVVVQQELLLNYLYFQLS